MLGGDIQIERITGSDWERARAVRLRSLADSPDAFGRTLAEEEAIPSDSWRERCNQADVATFLAALDGSDVGFVVGKRYTDYDRYTEEDRIAGLFGMWVAPEARGRGVGGALIEAVISWARENGYQRISLDVGDYNEPAIRLYQSKGFEPTGNVGSLPSPREHVLEHERVRKL